MHQLLKATVSHRPASPDSLNLARPCVRVRAPASQPPTPTPLLRPTAAYWNTASFFFTATSKKEKKKNRYIPNWFTLACHVCQIDVKNAARVKVTGTKCTPGDDISAVIHRSSPRPIIAGLLMTNVVDGRR